MLKNPLNAAKPDEDVSPDGDERIRDFLARHGGVGQVPERQEEDASGIQGWSEIYAADGYTLRCEWSRFGSREEMSFAELPPATPATAGDAER